MTRRDAERQEYVEKLRAILKPGDVVYTTVKHVSRSGMSRSIDVLTIKDNTPWWLSYMVAEALGHGFDERREAVKVGGCGMDMGFHLVYTLSRVLWPDGFECIGEGCRSNDHFNGDRDRTPHHHNDGGYALVQNWI